MDFVAAANCKALMPQENSGKKAFVQGWKPPLHILFKGIAKLQKLSLPAIFRSKGRALWDSFLSMPRGTVN